MIVKICGITRPEDAEAAAAAGADWIGLNFWPRSRRFVETARALEVVAAIPGDVKKVGVFVNAAAPAVEELAARIGLDFVQLHGDEDAAYCRAFAGRLVRALRVSRTEDLARIDELSGADPVLLDSPSAGYGGSGVTFDWALARAAKTHGKPIVLAGGLTPDNVAQAVREARPFGVDVAGGVERSPGIKDHDRMRRFVENAKGART